MGSSDQSKSRRVLWLLCVGRRVDAVSFSREGVENESLAGRGTAAGTASFLFRDTLFPATLAFGMF